MSDELSREQQLRESAELVEARARTVMEQMAVLVPEEIVTTEFVYGKGDFATSVTRGVWWATTWPIALQLAYLQLTVALDPEAMREAVEGA